MSSSSRSERILAAFALTCVSAPLAAAEETTLTEGAYFALTAENDDSDLEVGIALPVDGTIMLRPYGRIPFADPDAKLVRVDSGAVVAKVGLGLDLGFDWAAATGPATFLVASAQAEVGTNVYRFTPNGAPTEEARHQSFSARVLARYGWLSPGLQLGPQLSIVYDRSYVAADAIGIVVPATDGGPDTVQEVVVAPPSTTPALAIRAGSSIYLPRVASRLALGAYIVNATSGVAGGRKPWSEGRVIRGELWFYGFVKKPVQSRVGLALFVESTRAAAGADSERDAGVLVQLKANTTLFEY